MRRTFALQRDNKFGEGTRLSVDVDPATMLFRDDVMGHRPPKFVPFSRRPCCEQWIEYFVPNVGRTPHATITGCPSSIHVVEKDLRAGNGDCRLDDGRKVGDEGVAGPRSGRRFDKFSGDQMIRTDRPLRQIHLFATTPLTDLHQQAFLARSTSPRLIPSLIRMLLGR